MTYEEFAATMSHESGAHSTHLIAYAEIQSRGQGYYVFCPITDADVEMGLSCLVNIYPNYCDAERALYNVAVEQNWL